MLFWYRDRGCVAALCAVLLIWMPRSVDAKACQAGDEEKTLLWKIRGKTPSFLFGTIHVPYTRVWDSIPAKIKRAFRSADQVMVELILSDPDTASALSQCQLLPGSQRLRQVIPRQLYKRIKRHLTYVRSKMPAWLSNHGLSLHVRQVFSEQLFQFMTKDWERKRPFWVMLMINSLTEQDVKSRGIPVLDAFLLQEAERLTKRTGAVERVPEQCNPLNSLNSTHVLHLLNWTMIQHEAIRSGLVTPQLTTDDDVRQYICGNFHLLDPPSSALPSNPTTGRTLPSPSTTSESPIRSFLSITGQIAAKNSSITDQIDSYFRSEFIHKRNEQMARRIVQLIREKPNTRFFFAFGAGHFFGNNSVVSFVQEAGFRVDRVMKSKTRRKGMHGL